MINEEYLNIMTQTLEFEKSEYQLIVFGFILAVTVLSVKIIKEFKKAKRFDKIIMVCVIIAFCVVFCVYTFFYNTFKQNVTKDISTNEFVSYTGEFTHDDYQKDSFFHDVFINEGSKNKSSLVYPDYGNMYKIRSTDKKLPLGRSKGTLVYGKNSLIIVDWLLE